MNAYELADQLDNVKYQNGAKPFEMYANMLRQQADRIAELEKQGEPVAWMNIRTSKCVVFINTPPSDDWIPLYTAPQSKPLSDEEINKIKTLMEINYGCVPPLEFAWAIEERHGIK